MCAITTAEIKTAEIKTTETMIPQNAFNQLLVKSIDSLKGIVLDLKERVEKLEKRIK